VKAGELEVTDAAVSWMHGYGNTPDLFLFSLNENHRLGHWDECIWHPFPLGEDRGGRQSTLLLSVDDPWVKFQIWVDPPEIYGRGAITGKRTLTTGETVNVRSGWSSRVGAIHAMRNENVDIYKLLPEPIVDVSIFTPKYRFTGLAGCNLFLSKAEEIVGEFLPQCYLKAEETFTGEFYYHIRPKGIDGENPKPEKDSELDLATSDKKWRTRVPGV
jgi:hypothetical protein